MRPGPELRHTCRPTWMFLSAILGFKFHPLHPRFPANVWEYRDQRVIHFGLAKNENRRGRLFARGYALKLACDG